jgi:hypothetical protein
MSNTDDPMRVMSDLKPLLLDDLAAQGYRHRRQADLDAVASEARSARFAEPERPGASRRASPLSRIRPRWRLGVAVSAAVALVAGTVVAVQSSAPVVLTAQLLADRASAAALAQPPVNPGQWVYREIVVNWGPGTPNSTENSWETANDAAFYGQWSSGDGYDHSFPDYAQLVSLPRSPAALDAYLENDAGRNATPDNKAAVAFNNFDFLLSDFVLPPALQAEVYQALALLPGIQVDTHVTTIDGQAGVAFVQQATTGYAKGEVILNPSTYAYLAQGDWGVGGDDGFQEQAVKQMVLVAGPGSTQPSTTPPSAAELLAERAEQANAFPAGFTGTQLISPDRWVLRDLATSSGDQTVWATADDSEQASYVNGKLQVCARSAACAASTQWLMPVGPSYTAVDGSRSTEFRSTLPASLPKLLASLNSYSTKCTDVAGDCNAVNAIANVATGYGNTIGPRGALDSWFLLLADIPGVTVARVTDVTGQADVAFRFPFTDGITEILFNARTYELVGYVRGGSETVITKEVNVTGPGGLKELTISRPGVRTRSSR